MSKKISADIRVKPEFDATSVSTLDGGTVYPAKKTEWTISFDPAKYDSSIFSSTSTIFTGTSMGSGWSSGLTGGTVTGTFTSSGTWSFIDPISKWQRDIIIDVICGEIIGR